MLIKGRGIGQLRLLQNSNSARQKGHHQLEDMAPKDQTLKIVTAQVHTLHDPERALDVLETRVRELSSEHVDLALFPEVFSAGFHDYLLLAILQSERFVMKRITTHIRIIGEHLLILEIRLKELIKNG